MFEVPKSKRSIKQNRYQFKLAGKTFDIAKAQYLPMRAAKLFEEEKIVDGLLQLAEGNEALEDALLDLDGEQLSALVEDWQRESDVSLGESETSEG